MELLFLSFIHSYHSLLVEHEGTGTVTAGLFASHCHFALFLRLYLLRLLLGLWLRLLVDSNEVANQAGEVPAAAVVGVLLWLWCLLLRWLRYEHLFLALRDEGVAGFFAAEFR